MKNTHVKIGKALWKERKLQNLSQTKLGKLCKLDQNTISKIERGYCMDKVHLVANALGKQLVVTFELIDNE